MDKPLQTVVETAEYLRAAKQAGLSDTDRKEIVDHLARNPDDGVSLGGGLYKTRIARPGAGKSGGYRTVHFYRNETMPVFLLTIFAKNAQASLSAADRRTVTDEATRIGKTYGEPHE